LKPLPVRVALVAGNWKMHKTAAEAVALARALAIAVTTSPRCEVVICPPFTALAPVASAVEGSALRLGAQNLHPEPRGAFTGEISAAMLVAAGCTHVIVGHSERRRDFGESDALVARKAQAALAASLSPIVCVGETLAERDAGAAQSVVARQVEGALFALAADALARLAVAYEPVWAIGTGVNATPAQAQEMHAFVRARLAERFGAAGAAVRILYGGSVTPGNAGELLAQVDVDGALVGGASLEVESFVPIVEVAALTSGGER
jgi:triosephosphate isomerase